jgi:hypothetical protein
MGCFPGVSAAWKLNELYQKHLCNQYFKIESRVGKNWTAGTSGFRWTN